MIESLQVFAPELLANALRGAALLLVAHAILSAFRRTSAAWRDLAWTAAFAALLVLPMLGAFLPAWSASWLTRLVPVGGGGAVLATLCGIWLAGLVTIGGLFIMRHARAAALADGATPLADGGWAAATRDAARRLGLRQPPEVRSSPRVPVPLVVRSRILLPGDADRWDEARRDIVLLHEILHVSRRDYRTRLLVDLACALHWFDPLVWLARRRAAIAREQACDDAVLAAGVGRDDYATQLLAFARRLARVRSGAVVGLPMARPSTLETRLHALLDRDRRRSQPSLLLRLATVMFATAISAALGAAAVDGRIDTSGAEWPVAPEPSWSAPAPSVWEPPGP